jgi:hypothetical protein
MNQLLLAPGTTAPPRRRAGRQVPRQSRSPLTIAALATRSSPGGAPFSCPSHAPWARAASMPYSRTAAGTCSTFIGIDGARCGC